MNFLTTAFLLIACVISQGGDQFCELPTDRSQVAGKQSHAPEFSGEALDVVLTAKSAIAWDLTTGIVLYEKEVDTQRPVASLSKLITVIAARSVLHNDELVEIPIEARRAQLLGANVQLPIGHHARVDDLLAASLIASANDAAVSLAVAASGSEEVFVAYANSYIRSLGLEHTQLANATGLSGGMQYSTARDVRRALELVYQDRTISSYLAHEAGTLQTAEGATRAYETTNKLLGTYMPILAAKTGYTIEAGENLAIITEDDNDNEIGVVVLGSSERFQDTKVLVEWIWRNYTWPQ